jgi:2-polyprenyl-3-methyl-5-hydroxy-6-metoxy-1,4-benzoquinol methylase
VTHQREFPNWEQLYQEQSVESMPWFHASLDPDVEAALIKLDCQTGSVLDLGTGPGTQAIALAQRGFQVTATDLSATAVHQAAAKAQEQRMEISFKQDDILNSHLDQTFDVILDRGCFHVLSPEHRPTYVTTVANLLKPNGHLFLKCFSNLEMRESGPYRFTATEIQAIFASRFTLWSAEATVYHGTLNPLPKAIFCILKKELKKK